MHLATLVDRDIFAGYETFLREVKPDLVWRIGAGIVVERPAAILTVYEMTVVVLLVRPQSRDPARLPMLSPEPWIDPVVGIERRDDDIGNVAVALGVTRFARKLNTDLPELCWKRCIQDRLWVYMFHLGIALSVYGFEANAVVYDHFCSVAVAAAGAAVAAGFFRLLMMIVIKGAISRGKIPFNG
jgi:hypothetical protein